MTRIEQGIHRNNQRRSRERSLSDTYWLLVALRNNGTISPGEWSTVADMYAASRDREFLALAHKYLARPATLPTIAESTLEALFRRSRQ